MSEPMSRAELLKQPVDIRLSVADWLLLCGWCSAHQNESTPRLVMAAVRSIAEQVKA